MLPLDRLTRRVGVPGRYPSRQAEKRGRFEERLKKSLSSKCFRQSNGDLGVEREAIEQSYDVTVSEESRDYQPLARLVSGREELVCPRCGRSLLLRLNKDGMRRGMWFTGSFLCPSCDLGGED